MPNEGKKLSQHKAVNAKVQRILPRLTELIEKMAPRPGFLAGPDPVKLGIEMDPEIEGWEFQIIRVVVDATPEEAIDFESRLRPQFLELLLEDSVQFVESIHIEIVPEKDHREDAEGHSSPSDSSSLDGVSPTAKRNKGPR